MTKEALLKKIKNNQYVKIGITDIDGVLRGKVISKDKLVKSLDVGLGFCDVIFGWDSNDACYDNSAVTGWHTGYPDASIQLDISTFREIPWEGNLPFILADIKTGTPHSGVCPRNLLKKIALQAKELGFQTLFSQEFEWFNFRETSSELRDKNFQHLHTYTPGMFGYSILRSSQNHAYFTDLIELTKQFNVPLEGLHTETGPGVYECALVPSDVLEAADRAALLKTSVKEIAYKHEIMASFMAKWSMEYPGCSGHIHQSLWDSKGKKNLFYEKGKMSNVMQSYIAGQLHCLPYILPLFCPTVNSYKRLVEGSWAPTNVTWGIDNRTTALRALPGNEHPTRLETRIAGADVNPYLAMAAALASGLYGIKNQLKLEQRAESGSAYQNTKATRLSSNLGEAIAVMKSSKIANELFEDDFVNHFIGSREWEWKAYGQQVTDWELKRYFEII